MFTYANFTTEVGQKQSVIKARNQMVASGKNGKLSKGKYYKPENTSFGNIVKDLLEENGKISGYLTGYNQMGLTTQISNDLSIPPQTRL